MDLSWEKAQVQRPSFDPFIAVIQLRPIPAGSDFTGFWSRTQQLHCTDGALRDEKHEDTKDTKRRQESCVLGPELRLGPHAWKLRFPCGAQGRCMKRTRRIHFNLAFGKKLRRVSAAEGEDPTQVAARAMWLSYHIVYTISKSSLPRPPWLAPIPPCGPIAGGWRHEPDAPARAFDGDNNRRSCSLAIRFLLQAGREPWCARLRKTGAIDFFTTWRKI
jgi:hypothetical protein